MIKMVRLIRGLLVLAFVPCFVVALTSGALPAFSSISMAEGVKEEKVYLVVQGIASDADTETIKSALTQRPDIKNCKIDLKEGIVEVVVTEDSDLDAVVDVIEGAGYTVVDIMYED